MRITNYELRITNYESKYLHTCIPAHLLLLCLLSTFLLFLATINTQAFAKEETNFFLRADQWLFDSIYDEPPEIYGLNKAMAGITRFGATELVLGIPLALSAFGDERAHDTGKLMSSAIIGTGMTVYCLKELVRRSRPLEKELEGDPSFPSGHTGFSFTMATVLGHEYPKWRIPFYLGATLVGISRIYLGRHYPSDVLVGSLIGTLVGMQVTEHKEQILKWKF